MEEEKGGREGEEKRRGRRKGGGEGRQQRKEGEGRAGQGRVGQAGSQLMFWRIKAQDPPPGLHSTPLRTHPPRYRFHITKRKEKKSLKTTTFSNHL